MFFTLSLSSFNEKAALGRTFSCLGLWQSIVIAHNIVQAIWIKWVMLQFQEVLLICKIEFWCELKIAYLFGNRQIFVLVKNWCWFSRTVNTSYISSNFLSPISSEIYDKSNENFYFVIWKDCSFCDQNLQSLYIFQKSWKCSS